MKQTDNEIDALFERLSPEAAHEIDCQGVPTLKKRAKAISRKKKIVKNTEYTQTIAEKK